MNIEFRHSFAQDLRAIKNKRLRNRVRRIIELVEQAENLHDIEGVKKLRGGERYYRIRVGDYRIGLLVEENSVTFVRFLHRKDVYRYFP